MEAQIDSAFWILYNVHLFIYLFNSHLFTVHVKIRMYASVCLDFNSNKHCPCDHLSKHTYCKDGA
jgi:hypothetical protein